MDEELYLGIPGVDAPYPKYVQDALDFIEKETNPPREYNHYKGKTKRSRQVDFPPEIYGPTTEEQRQLERLWITRRKQKEAIQKKQPYQPYDRADQWPLF